MAMVIYIYVFVQCSSTIEAELASKSAVQQLRCYYEKEKKDKEKTSGKRQSEWLSNYDYGSWIMIDGRSVVNGYDRAHDPDPDSRYVYTVYTEVSCKQVYVYAER